MRWEGEKGGYNEGPNPIEPAPVLPVPQPFGKRGNTGRKARTITRTEGRPSTGAEGKGPETGADPRAATTPD